MMPEFDGDRLFSAAAHVDSILRFEAALARALARAGIIASSHGRARLAPAPRRIVLRESGVIGFPPVQPYLQLYLSGNGTAR